MKKKIIIPIVIVIVIIIGITGFAIFGNKAVTTITLDINPSIEINLTKNEKIKSVVALNDDAKDIVHGNLKGKSFEDALKVITDNVIDNGYAENGQILVLMYTSGNIDNEVFENKLKNVFGEKEIYTEIIIVDNITKEDKVLAKKYNITPSKAAYINAIAKENDNISVENLTEKALKELKETKDTGNYCEEGILEGSWCLKEINRENAVSGKVCPRGYFEYNDNCYEEVPSEDGENYTCRDDFKLVDNKCVREIEEKAKESKYSCIKGQAMTRAEAGLTGVNDGDANDIVCVDTSNATHPMSPCEVNDGTEYTIAGGKCYWHRAPVIESGCPGKIQIGSFCWDDASNILICVGARDGKQYSSRNEYCEGSIKYYNPVVTEYKCENKNAKLTGSKCIIKEIENAEKERVCPKGYTLVDNNRCINKNNSANKENGYVCSQENSRLQGSTCIIYEMIEAKHN